MTRVRALAGAAGALLLAAACGDGAARFDPLRHPDRMSIWTEERPMSDVEGSLAFLAANRLNLSFSLVRGETDRAYIEQVCRAAEAHDVAVRFWPGLSFEEGYWPNQANVEPFLAWVDELVEIGADVCPRLDGIVVDMEMPWDRTQTMLHMRADGASMGDIAAWLLEGIDEAAFERARGLYEAAGQRVRASGLTWTVTTLPMTAEDPLDWPDDETIAKLLWTPIRGIEWDLVSFQVYRSLFDEHFQVTAGVAYTSGLVGSYAGTIVQLWGERGAIDLGITGGGVGTTGSLAGPAELQADIAAALAGGIPPGNVALFSLEGLAGDPDAAAWVAVPAPAAASPTANDEEVRETFRMLDLLGS